MPTAQKAEKVREIQEQLVSSAAALLSDYRGITVKDATELREALREAEATFSVVKNTLAKLAADGAGLQDVESLLEGPTAITFVRGDVVLAAKRLADAAKRVPALEIKGAIMEGRVLTAEQARALATLESREVLLARMAGMAQASMARAAYAFNALQSKFLSLLEAYREKVPPGEAAAGAEAPEAQEPEAQEPAESQEPAEGQEPEGAAEEAQPAAEPEEAQPETAQETAEVTGDGPAASEETEEG